MTIKINLNADMAEGFGAYDIGDDSGILKIIGSANIACGFHAGDPRTMHKVITEAKANGVTIGVHPGFNDLWGFGRRRIDMRPDDLEYMVAYQIGALQAMATYAGVKVTHLKPHGALNNMAAEEPAIRARDRPRHQDRRFQHHLCRAGRLGNGKGRPQARAARCGRRVLRSSVRRRRQSDLAKNPGLGAEGCGRGDPAGDRHGRQQLHHLAQRQEDPLQGALAVRSRR